MAYGRDVVSQVFVEDWRNDGVEGVVAVDAHGPEDSDKERVDENAGQGVEGKEQRTECFLDEFVDVDVGDEADQPENQHEKEQGDERDERFIDHLRDALGELDDQVPVVEEFLHAHADEGDEDGGEESLGAQAIGYKGLIGGINLDHHEDDGGDDGADQGILLEARAQVVSDGEAGDDGEEAEGGGDRNLQQGQMRRDAVGP